MDQLAPSQLILARNVFSKIFASVDPFGEPFLPDQVSRGILFPTDWDLDENELGALAQAAAAVGDDSFFYLRDHESPRTGEGVVLIPLGSFQRYADVKETFALLDQILYSPSGAWGMIRSMEHHTVFGGRPKFGRKLLEQYPSARPPYDPRDVQLPLEVSPDLQVASFVDWYAELGRLDLVEAIVRHVEGERAARLLARADT